MQDSFYEFVKGAWDLVEPGTVFLPGMHVDAICEHLEACSRREIQKLLINIQPRSSKSTLVSVLYPAWCWTHTPTERFLTASYALNLAMRDSNRHRRIVKSEWFRERWPHLVIVDDNDTKSSFENSQTGTRQITSTDGTTTGLGGNQLIVDDPHNAKEAESAVKREAAIQWYRESFANRVNPGRPPVRIVVMQRLHQADLSGYLIGEGGWDHLCLPTEFEAGATRKTTSIGWTDPRKEEGEVLWKERYDTEQGRLDLDDLKKTLGAVGVAGQLQQRPVPRGGSTFKQEWLRFWYPDDQPTPEPVAVQKADGSMVECPQKPKPKIDSGTVLNSWDLAFKGGEKNDWVVGQVWARGVKEERANHYLLHQRRGHFDFVETAAAVKHLAYDWNPATILVEEKANGSAIITSLKAEVPGIIPINPEGGKESRASGIAPLFEAGNIFLPHPKSPGHDWVQAYIDELCMFPRGANDDQVDATTQALIRLRERYHDDIDMGPSMAATSRASPWNV